jgi:hypothetical protein
MRQQRRLEESMKKTTKNRIRLSLALTTLWLSACGGGGDSDTTIVTAPAPAPAPAAGQGPVAAPAPVAAAPGPAPAPAPVAAALGTSFTATGPVRVWHSLSSSADGQTIVGGQAGSDTLLAISRDGGATWTEGTDQGIWIASDVSADGNLIAAVQFNAVNGGVFISTDRGQSFVEAVRPPAITGTGLIQFESVTLTRDATGGNRIAAAVLDGPIVVGDVAADGSVNWLTPTTPAPVAEWRSIDSSADGRLMVAVAQDPLVYTSADGGLSWTQLAATTSITDQAWYRVKVSDDGSTIAMAANSFRTPTAPSLPAEAGDGIYVSRNGGAFVRAPSSPAGEYSAITMSADGGVIAATISNTNDPAGTATGTVVLSGDGGATFAPLTVNVSGTTAAETDWRAITMSGDATRMAVAAGRFTTNGEGAIYLTTGSRPTATAITPTPSTPSTTSTTATITPSPSTPSTTSTTATITPTTSTPSTTSTTSTIATTQ